MNHPLPRDAGEIEDYVDRKGPITYRRICNEISSMAPDHIYTCLMALEQRDRIERFEGNLHEDEATSDTSRLSGTDSTNRCSRGTTRDLWVSVDEQ